MATKVSVPLIFEIAHLPIGADYTPQELADAIAERIQAFAQQQFALFVTGSTEPTSDVGPWAANGKEWKYFEPDVGGYIPFELSQSRLGWQVSVEEPTDDDVTFWLQIDNDGQPLAINLRVVTGGSVEWVPFYYAKSETYTQAQIAAIAAAVVQPLGVLASKNASQGLTGNGTRDKITYGQGLFGTFDTASSRFVAPTSGLYEVTTKLHWQVSSGTPSAIRFIGEFRVNGIAGNDYNLPETEETGAQIHTLTQTLVLTAGDYVEFYAEVVDTGSASYLLAAGVNQMTVKRIG